MQKLSDKNKKWLKYGLIILPYLFAMFLIIKFQEEAKVQKEELNKQLEVVSKRNEEIKKEVNKLQEENSILKKELVEQKTKVKVLDKQVETKRVTERFDSLSGKLVERVEESKSLNDKSKTETKVEIVKKEEQITDKKETENKKVESKNQNTEIIKEKTTETKTYKKKKYGVNVGLIGTIAGVGPSISYSVLPITENLSVDISVAYVNKTMAGVQASTEFIDSVGVGIGIYITEEVLQQNLQLVPGVSVQYRF